MPADDPDLEQPDDRLGKGIVVRVADAANRRFDPSLGKSLGLTDRQVLNTTIAVMYQTFRPGP